MVAQKVNQSHSMIPVPPFLTTTFWGGLPSRAVHRRETQFLIDTGFFCVQKRYHKLLCFGPKALNYFPTAKRQKVGVGWAGENQVIWGQKVIPFLFRFEKKLFKNRKLNNHFFISD